MKIYDWCGEEEARLGRPVTLAEVNAAGWDADDVRAEPRLGLSRGKVKVLPRRIVAVEIRSRATNRVPKGGRHEYRQAVGALKARLRLDKILAGRSAAYTTHLIEEDTDG